MNKMIIKVWKTWKTWKDYTISVLYDTGTIKRYQSDNNGDCNIPNTIKRFIDKSYRYTIRQGETIYKLDNDSMYF